MVNVKLWKKKVTSFFISKYFFSFLFLISFFYGLFFIYTIARNNQNNKAFPVLYDLLERYQGAVNSSSTVPFDELLKDIEVAENKLGFFCSIKDQFIFLRASLLLQLKRVNEALLLLKKTVTDDSSNELNFLYQLVIAMTYAMSDDVNEKQTGILLLKKYAGQKKFQDVAIFYYGYFLLKTTSLKQADEIWAQLKYDPQFNTSPYKLLVDQARNCDY